VALDEYRCDPAVALQVARHVAEITPPSLRLLAASGVQRIALVTCDARCRERWPRLKHGTGRHARADRFEAFQRRWSGCHRRKVTSDAAGLAGGWYCGTLAALRLGLYSTPRLTLSTSSDYQPLSQ
jgi:hypothetical protein